MNLRSFCLDLLKDHGCPLDCYRKTNEASALRDVLELVSVGNKLHGFAPEDVAKELRAIGDEQPYDEPLTDYEFPVAEWYTGSYAGNWSANDLYADAEKNLKAMLESGEPFNTGWYESKHDTDSARITADRYHIFVQAGYTIDGLDDYGIIFDACSSTQEEMLEEKDLEEIADIINSRTDYGDFIDADFKTLPRTATYEEVMEAISDVRSVAGEIADAFFNDIKQIIRNYCNNKLDEVESEMFD